MRVRPEKGSFLAIAALHLGMGTIHRYSHTVADMRHTPFQLLFIILVVTVAPWVAVCLAWKPKMWIGASLFIACLRYTLRYSPCGFERRAQGLFGGPCFFGMAQ